MMLEVRLYCMVAYQGTAGLDVRRLAALLERLKIYCTLIDDDAASDRCVLQLSSVRSPGLVALLEYENKGFEPRVATIHISRTNEGDLSGKRSGATERAIRIRGRRRGDIEKIAEFISDFFGGIEESLSLT